MIQLFIINLPIHAYMQLYGQEKSQNFSYISSSRALSLIINLIIKSLLRDKKRNIEELVGDLARPYNPVLGFKFKTRNPAVGNDPTHTLLCGNLPQRRSQSPRNEAELNMQFDKRESILHSKKIKLLQCC